MRWFGWLAAAAMAGGILGLGAGAPVARADDKPAADKEAEVFRDILYYEGRDANPDYHRLDLYLPRGEKGYPVVLFLHGGSWRRGDKSYFGLNRNLALFCTRHHIGMALANYRLSPAVRHPEHVKDAARAFAWLHRNIGRYGGNPDCLFVAGHSAGGHLAALLATDATYLKAEGLGLANIRGVITLSGVFQIPDQNALFDHAFGTDVPIRRAASPTWQVSHWQGLAAARKAPPFLLLYADDDFAVCGKEPAEEFAQALRAKGCPVKTLEIKERNHLTILVYASRKGDPAGKALTTFVQEQCREHRPSGPTAERKNGT